MSCAEFQIATASERQFRAVFEGALDAMLITDEEGHYIDGNPSALALLGMDVRTLRSLHVKDVVVPRDEETLERQWSRFRELGRLEGEVVLRRADGTLLTAEYRATANIMPGMHLSVLRDVTERRAADARLAVAERMASVGTMAAGVAHEINNPLTTLMARLELAEHAITELRARSDLESLTGALASVGEHLTDAREAATRIMGIIRDVRLFARAGDDGTGPVDLSETLASALRIASTELRHRARVVTALEDVPCVIGNASRLGQVFVNLLINAAQAVPEGRVQDNEVRIASWFERATGMVVVEIADTGVGMSRETLARIFTPFFTTKPPGVGLGMGLAISQRLVTAMGGTLTARSTLAQGSSFRVMLRAAEAAPSPSATDKRAPEAPAGVERARLLIIDDESSIGSVVGAFFEVDHDVTAVTRGSDALERLERGERFDVIFCDLMMPHMTGMELYQRLRERFPEAAARVLFWTGGAVTQQARDFIERSEVPCLQKPFTLRALRDLVNARLRAARGW